MKYNHLENSHRRKKLVRSLKILAGFILLIVIILIYILLDNIKGSPDTVVTSGKEESVLTANVKTLKSPYFQFQAAQDWVEVPSVSTPKTYVYRQLNRQLIKREIQISVNIEKPPEKATRVLPVSIQANRLTPGTVSEHCNKAPGFSPGPDNPTGMTWQGIPIVCNPDSNDFSVIVDVPKAQPGIRMERPNGETIVYRIYYIDLSAVPQTKDLLDILNSFEPL